MPERRIATALIAFRVQMTLARATVVIATALPVAVLVNVLRVASRAHVTANLQRWIAGVPFIALVLTAPLWLIVLLRGVLYPALGSSDLEHSWGGPTLIGAWAVHLVIGVVLLLAASLLLALWHRPDIAMRERDRGRGRR